MESTKTYRQFLNIFPDSIHKPAVERKIADLASLLWSMSHDFSHLCPDAGNPSRALALTGSSHRPASVGNSTYSKKQRSAQLFSGLLEDTQGELLILGKRQWKLETAFALLSEQIYVLNREGHYERTVRLNEEQSRDWFNTKLVGGVNGEVYQINVGQGVLELDINGGNSVPVLSPGQCDFSGVEGRSQQLVDVHVGVHTYRDDIYGRPVWDVASDTDYLYVVPVVVVPQNAPQDGREEAAYLAAAKLDHSGKVVLLYDDPDYFDPAVEDNPDMGGLREIEVDRYGQVYVLNVSNSPESDTLWQYGSDGTLQWRLNLTDPSDGLVDIPNPVGLCASAKDDVVYLASGLRHESESNTVFVHAVSSADGMLKRSITIREMGQVADITEDSLGNIWVLGFKYDQEVLNVNSYDEIDRSFCQPRLAKVPFGENLAEVLAIPIAGDHDLDLPLSILWVE